MARLPDPTDTLTGADRALFDHMASARAHAEGRAHLGDVYVAMFNNPGLAGKVGALGEHLRFEGTLPDSVREIAILRYAVRQGFGYEWSHHQRPATLAGIDQATIDALTAGELPDSLSDSERATVEIVDCVCAKRSIPEDLQQQFTNAHGPGGVVELVVLCGLYAIMGYMCTAFDIEVEEGLPRPPFG